MLQEGAGTTWSDISRACINVITTLCCLRELHDARGKMHRRDKSRTRVKAKDVLYFNPEMYTPSHVAYTERYTSYNRLRRKRLLHK